MIRYETIPKTPRGILNAAADLIDEQGWTKGAMRDELGYCMAGAIANICHGIRVQIPPLDKKHEKLYGEHIVEYNDHTCQSRLDAMFHLREFARKLGAV